VTWAEIIQMGVGALVTGDILLTVRVKRQLDALVRGGSNQEARLAELERQLVVSAQWRADITGFLQSIGYRKRDGHE
jgi:hypothetical protein